MGSIAHKIAKFIQRPEKTEDIQGSRDRQPQQLKSSFKEVCNGSRWTTEASIKAHIQIQGEGIEIIGGTTTSEDLLSRCIVRKFRNSSQDPPLLNNAKRWACNTWKTTFGINVFAMMMVTFSSKCSQRSSGACVVRRGDGRR